MHSQIADAIAGICKKINWTDFTGKKQDKTDSLVSAIQIAKNEQDIFACIHRICKRYGVSSPDISTDLLTTLGQQSDKCMEIIRAHPQYIAMLALHQTSKITAKPAKVKKDTKNTEEEQDGA